MLHCALLRVSSFDSTQFVFVVFTSETLHPQLRRLRQYWLRRGGRLSICKFFFDWIAKKKVSFAILRRTFLCIVLFVICVQSLGELLDFCARMQKQPRFLKNRRYGGALTARCTIFLRFEGLLLSDDRRSAPELLMVVHGCLRACV